jgi:predicted amidophosphoribosyltransferase
VPPNSRVIIVAPMKSASDQKWPWRPFRLPARFAQYVRFRIFQNCVSGCASRRPSKYLSARYLSDQKFRRDLPYEVCEIIDPNYLVFNNARLVQWMQSHHAASVSSILGLESLLRTTHRVGTARLRYNIIHHINVLPFLACTTTKRYVQYQLRNDLLDALYVGWLYARRGPLSAALKIAKNDRHLQRQEIIEALCSVAWKRTIREIVDWVGIQSGSVTLTAVPSRAMVPHYLCDKLASELRIYGLQVQVDKSLLIRTYHAIEVKDLKWGERPIFSRQMFSYGGNSRLSDSVIVVDDVITSGSTMEYCAWLLKQAGARKVCGAAMCAALEDVPWSSIAMVD